MKKTTLLLALLSLILFVGCSKDEEPIANTQLTVAKSEVNMVKGGTFQIQASSETPITYSTENEYNSIVSTTGLITAKYVGETNIVLSNGFETKKIKVTVIPVYNLYPEPCLEFGITRSELITKYGTPDLQNTTAIGYSNYSLNAPRLLYVFDSNGKMTSASVYVKTEYTTSLGAFLSERYFPIDLVNYNFINAIDPSKVSMVVGASLYDTSYWMVTYIPNTVTKSMNISRYSTPVDIFKQ